jgi:hypothetical protein
MEGKGLAYHWNAPLNSLKEARIKLELSWRVELNAREIGMSRIQQEVQLHTIHNGARNAKHRTPPRSRPLVAEVLRVRNFYPGR